MLSQTLLASLGAATLASAACTREAMGKGVESYISAQTLGQVDVLPFVSAPPYTENRKPRGLNQSIVTTRLNLNYNSTIYDTTFCTTWSELIDANAQKPYVVGMRLAFDTDGKYIKKMDSIVTKPGDWLFNATGTLQYFNAEDWPALQPAQRTPRAALKAAADAYADMFANATSVPPFGTPCCRVEGGMTTCASANSTSLNTCVLGIPDAAKSPVYLKNREYVIDEVDGTVQVLMDFGAMADSHLFRMREGFIRWVHTMTAEPRNGTMMERRMTERKTTGGRARVWKRSERMERAKGLWTRE